MYCATKQSKTHFVPFGTLHALQRAFRDPILPSVRGCVEEEEEEEEEEGTKSATQQIGERNKTKISRALTHSESNVSRTSVSPRFFKN